MRLSNIKRIVKEDFDTDDQAVAERIGYIVNGVFDQLSIAFNKNIDFDNLNQEILSFDIIVDSNGIPKNKTSIKTQLNNVRGLICIRATPRNSNVYVNSAPFISYLINSSERTLSIQHITGIPADKPFNLVVIAIG